MFLFTTPTIKLTIPYTVSEISNFVISFVQQDLTVLEKSENSTGVTLSNKLVTIELTQEESGTFVTRYPICVQMKIKLATGKVVASDVEYIYPHKVLNTTEFN